MIVCAKVNNATFNEHIGTTKLFMPPGQFPAAFLIYFLIFLLLSVLLQAPAWFFFLPLTRTVL